MSARVVDLLEPAGQLAVELCERARRLAWQAQAGFKILLEGAEHPFDFAPAPGVAGFGVDQANAQVGADDLEVIVDEGTSVVGVEFAGKVATAESFLQAAQEGLGVSGQSVGGEGDEARMIIEDHAQMSGQRLGVQGQERSRGEVGDPEVVGAGGFKGLGRAGDVLAQEITSALGIQVVLLQPAINGREGRESGIGLLPLAVEEFDGHSGKGADPFQDPLLLVGGQTAGFAAIATCFGF